MPGKTILINGSAKYALYQFHSLSGHLAGDTGSGKEIAASAVYLASSRKDHPMVILEYSGVTEPLFESKLLDHTKGAFTGALYNKQGPVEVVHGGTLFLD